MQETELLPHLFRTEYRKLIAVLCKLFGLEYIQLAEDMVSDTFLSAAETWGLKGLPANPVAWLYAVSKNKAIDVLRHQKRFVHKVVPALQQAALQEPGFTVDLSEQNIEESQLQMMFAICHPCLSTEAQISLCLNILCGFGGEEIADGFLVSKDVIYKRLTRAKEKLRAEKIVIELPSKEKIKDRLAPVLTALYLLFSEGYYSTSHNTTLRKELCLEAMRLTVMLIENDFTNTPAANALLALMCFHASRFDARLDNRGQPVLYEDQNEALWNTDLIQRGEYYLNLSSTGTQLSKYHLEAAIAYWHTHKADSQEKWESILQLYNQLLQVEYSPIAALNRTYALSKANGKEEAITEAKKLQLTDSHLYHCLLGNLYKGVNDEKAMQHLKTALTLARTAADQTGILKKIAGLKKKENA